MVQQSLGVRGTLRSAQERLVALEGRTCRFEDRVRRAILRGACSVTTHAGRVARDDALAKLVDLRSRCLALDGVARGDDDSAHPTAQTALQHAALARAYVQARMWTQGFEHAVRALDLHLALGGLEWVSNPEQLARGRAGEAAMVQLEQLRRVFLHLFDEFGDGNVVPTEHIVGVLRPFLATPEAVDVARKAERATLTAFRAAKARSAGALRAVPPPPPPATLIQALDEELHLPRGDAIEGENMRYETARAHTMLRDSPELLKLLGHWTTRKGIEALLSFSRVELTEQHGAEGIGSDETAPTSAVSWSDFITHMRREVPLFRELRVALEEELMQHRCADLRRVFDFAVVATTSNEAVVRLHGAKAVNKEWLDCDVARRVYGLRSVAPSSSSALDEAALAGLKPTALRTRTRLDDGCAIKMLRHHTDSDSALANWLKKGAERSMLGESIQIHRVSWISWEGAVVWALRNRACDAWGMLRADLLRLAAEADLQAVAAWIRWRALLSKGEDDDETADGEDLTAEEKQQIIRAKIEADNETTDAPFRLSRAAKILGEAQTQLFTLVDVEHPGCCGVFSSMARLAIVADSVQRIRSNAGRLPVSEGGIATGATAALQWQTRVLNAKTLALGVKSLDVAAAHRAIAQLNMQCGNEHQCLTHALRALDVYRKLLRYPPPFDSVEERLVARALSLNRNGDWCLPCLAHAETALLVGGLELRGAGQSAEKSTKVTHVHDAVAALQEAATVLRRLGDDSAAHKALWTAACALRKQAKRAREASDEAKAKAAPASREKAVAQLVRISVFKQIIEYSAPRAKPRAASVFGDPSREQEASVDAIQLSCAYEWLGDVHEASALEAVAIKDASNAEIDDGPAPSAEAEENAAKAAEELIAGLLRKQGKRASGVDVMNIGERILSEFSNALDAYKHAQVIIDVNYGPRHRQRHVLANKIQRIEALSAASGGAPDTPDV